MAEKNDEKTGNYPFAHHKATIYIAKQIEALKHEKTQREIALEIGYEKPNMISMMKRGEVRVPFEKTFAIAEALNVSPIHLFRLVMGDQFPGKRDVVDRIIGEIITDNERAFLVEYRKVTGDKDPPVTAETKKRLKEVFTTKKPVPV